MINVKVADQSPRHKVAVKFLVSCMFSDHGPVIPYGKYFPYSSYDSTYTDFGYKALIVN